MSLMVLTCAGVLLALTAGLAVASGLVVSHRRAQSVADLAALAGAESLRLGGEACDEAASIATAAEAVLIDCDLQGADVLVTIEVAGPTWRGHSWRLSARARAGPDPAGADPPDADHAGAAEPGVESAQP